MTCTQNEFFFFLMQMGGARQECVSVVSMWLYFVVSGRTDAHFNVTDCDLFVFYVNIAGRV